ncbi:MAG TPA: hypothetical protein VIG64_15730, partial [Actinomycetota bacterium]
MDDAELSGDRLAKLLATYGVIGQRRTSYDQMGWQTPALSFTAQAFLFSIALAPDATRMSRVMASVLALVISLASIQLLRKHLYLELVDSATLSTLENAIAAYQDAGLQSPPHSSARLRKSGLVLESGEAVSPSWLESLDSSLLWTVALALFGLSAVVIIVTSIF